MDIADLYDHEIAKIGPIWKELMQEFAHKPNNQKNLAELAKKAQDKFRKIGLIIDLNTMPCIMADSSGHTSGPEIIILGRLDKAERDGEYDHERKRFEVIKSKQRNEAFLGQKEKPEQ